MPIEVIEAILHEIKNVSRVDQIEEISFELNPGTVDRAYLEALKNLELHGSVLDGRQHKRSSFMYSVEITMMKRAVSLRSGRSIVDSRVSVWILSSQCPGRRFLN